MTHAKVDEASDKMHKAVVHLQDEFGAIRTGRATPALVEKLKVDYYGSEVPLQQLAGFSVPEARVLVISPYDKGALKAIEKLIQSSDLGVNPSNDGAVIRLTFPELTTDRRKDLVKVVKKQAEDARVAVRNLRRDASQNLDLSMSKSFPFGERRYVQLRIEMFNITNHVTFGPAGIAPTNTAFGTIASQANSPRGMQVGTRVVW
jgi:ribosome recycling factor